MKIQNLMALAQPNQHGLGKIAQREEGEYLDIKRVKAFHVANPAQIQYPVERT